MTSVYYQEQQGNTYMTNVQQKAALECFTKPFSILAAGKKKKKRTN